MCDELERRQPLVEQTAAEVGRAHRHVSLPTAPRRLPSRTCSRTTTSRNPPRMTDSQYELIVRRCFPFSNTIRLKISCRSSTPTSVERTEPTPPVRRVPPTTTAAIADSSHPCPAAVSTDPVCEARKTPAH